MSISPDDKPTEFQARQYYVHKSYVNTYYAMYKYLEGWLASNVFRNDLSRVFLASDEYAYRRRFELTDTSKDFDTLDFSSLRFPFANYWPQNSGWIPDERIAAKQAALTYTGIFVGNTKLRVAASILPINVTLYFDREDDARLAYDILYFKSFNEHYYETTVTYGTDYTSAEGLSPVLRIPANMSIPSLKFNPTFKESDWLKKQRIFVIQAQFDMRSFVILPPKQPDYTIDENDYDMRDSYDDGIDFYYIVDDVILNVGQQKLKFYSSDAGYNPSDGSYIGSHRFPDIGEKGTVYIDDYVDTIPNNKKLQIYIWDDVSQKYIEPETNIDSVHIRYNGSYEESKIDITKFDFISNIKQKTNLIEWSYGENTSPDDLEKIELHMTGENDIIEIDPHKTSYKLEKLNPNSQYYGYMTFYSKDGSNKRFIINFVTQKKKTDSTKTLNSLVGYTW